jgi:N-acetylmuramoyl-L-alanine amidase
MFRRAHNPAEDEHAQREAILDHVLAENLRLRKPGYHPRKAQRIQRPGRRFSAAFPFVLIAVAGALYHLMPNNPIHPVASLRARSTVSAKAHAQAPSAVVSTEQGFASAGLVVRNMAGSARSDAFASDSTPMTEDADQAVEGDQPSVRQLFGLSVKTIVIDAGHGGHDPGAIGKATGIREKDVTLDIARRLKEKLGHDGKYRVLLVRDSDMFVALNERAAYANARETDLFISIHVNYVPGTSSNAIETYYFGQYQDVRTRALAQRENQYSSYAISEFEELLKGMKDRMKLHESKNLALAIQASLLGNIRRQDPAVLDTGVKTAPFAVLLGVKAPSILAEISNLSSPEAERSLGSAQYRDAVAAYIASGISDYLNHQPQEAERHVKVEDGISRH